jgi:hypothetical protein
VNEQMMVALGALAVIGLLAVYGAGRGAARQATQGVREVTRLTANAVRTVTVAAVITGVQWLVVTHTTDPRVLVATLVVPAVFAGASVARLLAVTEVVHRAGGRR